MGDKKINWILRLMFAFGTFLILTLPVSATAPRGDYGDAPDGSDAYDRVSGSFPTLYSSNGGHTLIVGEEMIGTTVSAEVDANDASDPDGVQNLVDQDKDDPVYTILKGGDATFRFQVTIAQGAPAGKRYINVLVDFNQNGVWDNEWVVKNLAVEIPPGRTEWVETPSFHLGASHPWVRLAITRSPIDADDWDGTGEFQYGEIQDFKVGPAGGGGGDGGGGGGGEPGKPGPDKGPCTTPVAYHALVINGGDNPKQTNAHEVGAGMAGTFSKQGYNTAYLGQPGEQIAAQATAAAASLANIEAAINELKANVKCVDRVMVFIIGHGLEKGSSYGGKSYPGGGVILQSTKEVLTPEKLNELLGTIPACPGEDCKKGGVTCHMSVMIESCHSGNFFDSLKGEGKTVAVSSSSDELSYFGSDGTGGDYSDGFISDIYDPVKSDTDKDGYVSVAEAHKSATDKLKPPAGGKQTPSISSQECECLPMVCTYKIPGTSNGTPAQTCGHGTYASSNCNGVCKQYQKCVKDRLTNCYSCVTVCGRDQYTDSNCFDKCGLGYCALQDASGPCYECRTMTPISHCQELGMYDGTNCDGKCGEGEVCMQCPDTDCYKCERK